MVNQALVIIHPRTTESCYNAPMVDLRDQGMAPARAVHANLPPAVLIEISLARKEGVLADNGALVTQTGKFTGRAPRDKYLVSHPDSQEQIAWGPINQPMIPEAFDRLLDKVKRHLEKRELFVFDGWAGADHTHRFAVRVITENAWHALFANRLLLRPFAKVQHDFQPRLTIYHAPELMLDPACDGSRSEVAIALDLDRGLVFIAGTHYAGEIKKSVFTFLNYQMPRQGVFPMHCSANVGKDGATALLFGLSGTGKTTLSADPQRRLIGDDEHGWSDQGVFNFEGGCYAKCIRLSPATEPQIHSALRFGAVLENVVLDPVTRRPDYDDASITENTRAAYPVDFIPGIESSGAGGHPRHVLFLTCDAYGVLPPLSKLTAEQALYHFLSGYTARVAGTEAGVKEPQATFSTCFGAPFLPLPAERYAEMLHARLLQHQVLVWLVNTGWTGGPYGEGRRIPLGYTRALVSAALNDTLKDAEFWPDPVFGILVPNLCPGIPADLLKPRWTWRDPQEYDCQARKLAELFQRNFAQYESQVPDEVCQAGPRI